MEDTKIVIDEDGIEREVFRIKIKNLCIKRTKTRW